MLNRIADIGLEMMEQEITRARAEVAEMAPRPAGPCPQRNFAILATSIRLTLALHARLEAGLLPTEQRPRAEYPRRTPRPAQPAPRTEPSLPPAPPACTLPAAAPPPPEPASQANPPADIRREGIASYILKGLEMARGPTAAETLRPEIEARIAAALANDPEGETAGADIISAICAEIGLPLYHANLGPELIYSPQMKIIMDRFQTARTRPRVAPD